METSVRQGIEFVHERKQELDQKLAFVASGGSID
jgi:hypothetical protein